MGQHQEHHCPPHLGRGGVHRPCPVDDEFVVIGAGLEAGEGQEEVNCCVGGGGGEGGTAVGGRVETDKLQGGTDRPPSPC